LKTSALNCGPNYQFARYVLAAQMANSLCPCFQSIENSFTIISKSLDIQIKYIVQLPVEGGVGAFNRSVRQVLQISIDVVQCVSRVSRQRRLPFVRVAVLEPTRFSFAAQTSPKEIQVIELIFFVIFLAQPVLNLHTRLISCNPLHAVATQPALLID
jgi:hypothetical protein